MSYLEGFDQLMAELQDKPTSTNRKMLDAMKRTSILWKAGAVKRAPVDDGLLRASVLREHGKDAKGEYYAAVGSNQDYAKFVEFGTSRIAGGAVKALGESPNITDAQAIKTWPALEKDGGSREQMPWLRPSYMAIQGRVLAMINAALKWGGDVKVSGKSTQARDKRGRFI